MSMVIIIIYTTRRSVQFEIIVYLPNIYKLQQWHNMFMGINI